MTIRLDAIERVEAVVVTFESAPHLPELFEMLAGAVPVTVIDNGSRDDSVAIARSAGANVLVNEVNLGFGAAANQGLHRATRPYVLLLNPDAAIAPDAIDTLARALDERPDLVAVSPRLRTPTGEQQRVWWPFPSAAGAWREAFGLHRLARRFGRSRPRRRPRPRRHLGPGATSAAPDRSSGTIIGACALVRCADVLALGGFDARYWLYAEEADLFRRAADRGLGVAVVESVEARHLGGGSGESVTDLVVEHFERGGELFVDRFEGRGALLSYRLATLVGAGLRSILLPSRTRRAHHRSRARRALRLLLHRPLSVDLGSPVWRESASVTVLCSHDDLGTTERRNHHFVRQLLALDPTRRILIVRPPFDRLHELRRRRFGHRRGERAAATQRQRGLRPWAVDSRAVVLQPVKHWPRVMGPFADRSLRRQIRRALRQLGIRHATLWINHHEYASLVAATGWPALYDITDDWMAAAPSARDAARIRAWEDELFARCDTVVVCSEDLRRSRQSRAREIEVITNGVDRELFTTPAPRPTGMPSAPIAVYVGSLHADRLDIELLLEVADAMSQLTVVLVGPDSLDADSRGRLTSRSNITLTGPRPHAEIPAWMQHADVVIVPHRITPFTESLDPIKAYESRVVNTPTVATAVAGFRGLGGHIHVVDRDRFVPTVAGLLDGSIPADGGVSVGAGDEDGGDDDASDEGGEVSGVPTWADQARRFAEVLDRVARQSLRPSTRR